LPATRGAPETVAEEQEGMYTRPPSPPRRRRPQSGARGGEGSSMGRRRYRRARHRRNLAITFVVVLLVCLGVLVAVAVNALSFERPDSAVPVLLPDSQETPSTRSP
jgi:hypothetical protein